jgi:hypothetical protein
MILHAENHAVELAIAQSLVRCPSGTVVYADRWR